MGSWPLHLRKTGDLQSGFSAISTGGNDETLKCDPDWHNSQAFAGTRPVVFFKVLRYYAYLEDV
ncbi:hypothetical protein J2Y63_001100 [Shinella sp. BE166]|uniref:hypothetical protein n=1 Tax=Shinella sp. BE166 TaxID=3373918 RepID=UPI003EBF2856